MMNLQSYRITQHERNRLIFLKKMLILAETSHRISDNEGTLHILKQSQRFYDEEKARVLRRRKASNTVAVKSEVAFEYALQEMFG